MSRPDERRVRESIAETGRKWREHCARNGKTISQEQATDRVRDAFIRHEEKPNQR